MTTNSAKGWLGRLSNALLREPHDQEELLEMLRDAKERALLDAEALHMIEGVLAVSAMQVRDIMVPRAQMVVVEADATPNEFLPALINSHHSRFPVIGETRDEVLGILMAKDLLRYLADPQESFSMQVLLHPAVLVPESKHLNVLLAEFRQNHKHMAIVVNEYGGIAGLVTIEDVLEQIVGDIEDEYDVEEETNIKAITEQDYLVKALTPVAEFNQQFGTDFSDEEYDTIGGIVAQKLGHLPQRGELVRLGNLDIKILHADQRRVHLLRVMVKR